MRVACAVNGMKLLFCGLCASLRLCSKKREFNRKGCQTPLGRNNSTQVLHPSRTAVPLVNRILENTFSTCYNGLTVGEYFTPLSKVPLKQER